MTLLLLRHGESEGNRAGVVQGGLDHYALTPLGREQAGAAARRLAGLEIDVLYSSTLRRARETAEIVAAQTGHEVVELHDLREYGFGGGAGAELGTPCASASTSSGGPGGAGASPARRAGRTSATASPVRSASSRSGTRTGTAVAVLHGGVLGATVARICDLEDSEYAQIFTANCGITEVAAAQDGRLTLRSLNDVCHLRSLGGARTEPWLSEA